MLKEKKINSSSQRQNKILNYIEQKKRVSVRDLSDLFNISEVTIRSDLNEISKHHPVVRTYGGAILIEEFNHEQIASQVELIEKNNCEDLVPQISALVNDGDVVYIDGIFAIEQIVSVFESHTETTIITPNILLAGRLCEDTDVKVIMLGGEVDSSRMVVPYSDIKSLVKDLNISKAFLYASGMTVNSGFTSNNQIDSRLKKSVIEISHSTIVLIETDRIGTISLSTFATIDQIDTIITGALSSAARENLRRYNINIIETEKGVPNICNQNDLSYSIFNKYRTEAKLESAYTGKPGNGKRLVFASALRSGTFCQAVEAGIRKQAQLAGFLDKDIIVLDNNYSVDQAIINAEYVLNNEIDVFIEFQVDNKTNNHIKSMFKDSPVKLIALDCPMHGAYYVGVDDWKAGYMAGETAYSIALKKWGSWNAVEVVVLFEMLQGGEATMLRGEGFLEAIYCKSGSHDVEQFVKINIGDGREQQIDEGLQILLSSYPLGCTMILTAITEQALLCVLESLKSRKGFDPNQLTVVGQGGHSNSEKYIKEGIFDASVIYYPEKYGEYLIPLACTLLDNQPAPTFSFVDTKVITHETYN